LIFYFAKKTGVLYMLSSLKKIQYEKSERYSFSKNNELLEVFDLNAIQLDSFEDFKDNALDELFEEFFPIKSNNDRFHIQLVEKKE